MMKNSKPHRSLAAAGFLLCSTLSLFAAEDRTSAVPTPWNAQRLLEGVVQSNMGFHDFTAEIEITRRHETGKENQSVLNVNVLEQPDGTKKRMVTIQSPKLFKGISALMIEHKGKETEIWVNRSRLWNLQRLRRNDENAVWANRDFSLQDLESLQQGINTAKLLREETREGCVCAVIEVSPTDKETLLLWIDDLYRVHELHVRNAAGDTRKTVILKDYRKYLDAPLIWRPQVIETNDPEQGVFTVVKNINMRFHVGLTDADFDSTGFRKKQ